MNEQPVYYLPVYGDVELKDSAKGIILHSPDGTKWRVQVDDTGTLTVTAI